MENSTIAAISTPESAGGIGVIRISGDDALKIASKIFRPVSKADIENSKGYRAYYGKVFDGESAIDEAVCTVFRAPHSYTGENTAEISCHGGLYVTKAVLRAAFNAGAAPAGPGEFTKRAFLNGKIDLAASEAVMKLISANGKEAAKAALNTLEGRLSGKIREVCNSIVEVCANLAAWVDYPYDEIEETSPEQMLPVFEKAKADIEKIIADYDCGKLCTEGIDTVIAGKPNVGKSTLMNLLAGCDRSIVTSVAGTTRDIVEETVRLGSVVLRIADTAGIRETGDEVEKIGVDRAKKRLDRAGLVLAVFDGSRPFDSDDADLLESCKNKNCIAVINKTDLPLKADISFLEKYIKNPVMLSASTGQGAQELTKAVEALLLTDEFNPESPCLASERQRECCVRALGFVNEAVSALRCGFTLDAVTVVANCAVDALLELTGEKAADAVIDNVFSRFCVGK